MSEDPVEHRCIMQLMGRIVYHRNEATDHRKAAGRLLHGTVARELQEIADDIRPTRTDLPLRMDPGVAALGDAVKVMVSDGQDFDRIVARFLIILADMARFMHMEKGEFVEKAHEYAGSAWASSKVDEARRDVDPTLH